MEETPKENMTWLGCGMELDEKNTDSVNENQSDDDNDKQRDGNNVEHSDNDNKIAQILLKIHSFLLKTIP